MKNSSSYKITFALALLFVTYTTEAQLISDEHISKNFNCIDCNLKSTTLNSHKTLRINFHFISRSDGTGNFGESTNIFGNTSSENGYWISDLLINQANNYLANNVEMTQQLSYSPIPVEEIKYSYKLNGVFFHKNDSFYECYFAPNSLTNNIGCAINIFIFAGRSGNGAAYYDACWIGGIESSYSDYIANSNTWHLTRRANILNHEIGHILSLDHPKRSPGGLKSTIGGTQYTDNCNDTPTFMELINDGYSDPYQWCNGEYSNNIMDYSCQLRAFTPCQINQVHSYIECCFTSYLYGNYQNSHVQINNFSENMAYIAEIVEIPTGASITIPNSKKLYIDAQELIINGEFFVPLGSTFEFTPYGL